MTLNSFVRRGIASQLVIRHLRCQFDWKQRTNGGSLLTWGGFQGYRWLWLGPFYFTWEWRRG